MAVRDPDLKPFHKLIPLWSTAQIAANNFHPVLTVYYR